jgi:hypothetical protein
MKRKIGEYFVFIFVNMYFVTKYSCHKCYYLDIESTTRNFIDKLLIYY